MNTSRIEKPSLVLLSLGALLLAAPVAWAQPGWGRSDNTGDAFRKGRRGQGMRGGLRDPELLAARLGLSAAQAARVKRIHENLRGSCTPLREQLLPLQRQMKALVEADIVDAAQIYALHAQFRSLRQQIADERIKARTNLLQLLSKDQRVKLLQHRGRSWRKAGGLGRSWRGAGGRGQPRGEISD